MDSKAFMLTKENSFIAKGEYYTIINFPKYNTYNEIYNVM